MREFSVSDNLEKILTKLKKKDKIIAESILKKIDEIVSCDDVSHYKNLHGALQDLRRVHVGSFVLTFTYDSRTHRVEFIDFEHHDNAYRN